MTNNEMTNCDDCDTTIRLDAVNLDEDGNVLCDACMTPEGAPVVVRKKRDYNSHANCGHPLTPKARAACRKSHR